jgi:hypothetical protein
MDLTKVINKPALFNGSNNLRDWVMEMAQYLDLVCWDPDLAVGIATQFLRGEAMQWWSLKRQELTRAGVPIPRDWEGFKQHLFMRFDHKNPEAAARDKLQTLRQGKMTVMRYLKEFEGCYAHIPEYSESDRIHRFVFGLNGPYKHLGVDPSTKRHWTSWDSMVGFLTAYISAVAPTELLQEVLKGGSDSPPAEAEPSWATVAGKKPHRQQQGQQGNKGQQQHRNQQQQRRQGQQRTKGQQRQGDPLVTWTNGAGNTLVRRRSEITHCMKNHTCINCFQEIPQGDRSHTAATCKKAVKQGHPPGYEAPSK